MTKMLLLVLVMGVAALPPRPKHIPRFIFGRPYGGFLNQINFSSREDAADMYDCQNSTYFEGFVSQPVDHFASNSSNWTQLYQYNSKFYNGSSSLAFLLLGGESPIAIRTVCKDNMPYITWAKKHGATVFQVEHRYFGRSRPTPTLTVPNLKWLTPEQTLADYNNFIEQMNAKYFPKKQMRWLLFGGSYAGVLSAWMRVAYPNSSIAAVSSSSAMNLMVDNYNGAVNMQKNYERTNRTCAINIGAAFKKIQSQSYSFTGREKLEDILNLCTPFSYSRIRPKDLQYFWANIFSEFQNLNQYSGDNREDEIMNEAGMPKACEIMNNATESHLMARVRNVLRWVGTLAGEEEFCTANNYDEYLAEMLSVTFDEFGELASERAWIYQCCSYLGYFSTTDGGYDSGIWGSILPVDFYVDQCFALFSPRFNVNFAHAQVKKYREMFGGAKHYKGDKCIFVNGNMDPWYSLGLLQGQENQENQVFATTIDGGTHCSDMYPAGAEDSASLTTARAFIASKLDYFIRSG